MSLPSAELHPFPNHPFKVRDDETMQETTESIRQYGVLVPAIVRPREEGGYEIVAGHRRKHACELAGLETMPVIVRNLDADAAAIIMVDSNLQRENILPSERAQAYGCRKAWSGAALRRGRGRIEKPGDGLAPVSRFSYASSSAREKRSRVRSGGFPLRGSERGIRA